MPLFKRLRQIIADLIAPELRAERRSLAREASTDALTGLANRRALDRALPAAEADPHTRVVVFDANDFGLANKACGQDAGDELLRALARSIKRSAERFGFGERVFRRGGDEFVVLASELAAYHIRDAAESDFVTVTVRPGLHVSLSGTVGRTFAEADSALQARKATRKGSAAAAGVLQEVQA